MNVIQTITKNVRLQNWTTIIQDRKASGQTVDDYCAVNHISICIGDATIHVNESSSGDLLRMVIEAVRHAE